MKLHLPCILRAAVLASVALSSVHHTMAAPAEYHYMIHQDNFGPWTTDTAGVGGVVYVQHRSLPDARAQSWVLNIEASNISPDEEVIPTTDILSFGPVAWATENDSRYQVTLVTESGFGIFVAPDSDIVLAYNQAGASTKTVTHVLSHSNNWNWSSVANVNVTLSWNAEEERLTLEGGSVQRRADGAISNLKRIERLDYNLPSSWFIGGDDILDTLVFMSGAGASVSTTLYKQGNEAGWLVSGRTELGTEYDDKIANSQRAIEAGDKVQFVGVNGVIYAKETATFGNAVTSSIDLQDMQAGQAIGFGAADGAELSVTTATNIINNAAGEALVPELNIVGNGVVKLCYNGDNAANLSAVQVNIDENATLKIDDNDTFSTEGAEINLSTGIVGSNASVVKTGKDTGLTIVTESGSAISLNTLENENGSIDISGAGSLKVQNVVTMSGDISISGGASHQVKNLDIDGDIIINGGNSLSTTGDVEIAGEAQVTGTLNTTQSDSLNASVVAVQGEGVVLAKKIAGNAVKVAGVTVGGDSPATRTLPTLLEGNVMVNSTGIVADEIAAGTPVEFSAGSSGTVTVGKMTDVNMTVGGVQVLTEADTVSTIVMSGTSTVARGTITAKSATVTDEYELAAQRLELTDKLDSDTTEVLASGTETAVLEDVSIYNAKTEAGADIRVLQASGIKAATVTVQNGSVLIGPDVEVSDVVNVGEKAILEDVRVDTVNGLIVDDGASLNNVIIKDGTMKNANEVVLNNVTFQGSAASYGGAAGKAIVVDSEKMGVDNVQITGTLNGGVLTVDRMVVNAEKLEFSNAGDSYEIMQGDDISYQPSVDNYQLNIESFVRAELSYDETTGEVTLTGHEDEEGIKNELNSTPNREAAMGSLNSALPVAEAGSPLANINEHIGHVNRFSLTERQQVLDAASGASLVALADAQRRGLHDSQRNIRNRVIQMGGGTSKGLTTDWQYAGLQTWAQADAGYTSIDGSQDECGYDFDTTGATVGANVDLTGNLVVGMAFSASYGDIDVESMDSGTAETSSYYLNFFGRYQSNRWVHMLIFTVGMDEMDTERRVLGYKASGNTDGTTYSLYYELGYTIGLDYEFNHIIQPLVSVSLTSAQTGDFEEGGSIGNAGLRYDGEDLFYGQLAVGARYQGVLYESVHERCAVIEARAVATHDIGDKTDQATLSFMNGNTFTVKGVDATGFGFEIGAGLSIPVEQHTTLFADAEFTYAPEYTGFRANIGVRYDF